MICGLIDLRCETTTKLTRDVDGITEKCGRCRAGSDRFTLSKRAPYMKNDCGFKKKQKCDLSAEVKKSFDSQILYFNFI